MNWFILGAGLLYIGACLWSLRAAHPAMGMLYASYAIANFVLAWVEYHRGG